MRPKRKIARGQIGTGQGNQHHTQGQLNHASLGTDDAGEARICSLRAVLDAAAVDGDLVTYKQRLAEYQMALSARSPEQASRLDAQHLAAVERAVALSDHGQRLTPTTWLTTGGSRTVAWCSSLPGADQADARRAA